MDKKALFTRAYANLPFNLRQDILIVVDDQPMTWNAVWLEVEQGTALGERILEKLVRLGVLKNE